LRINHFLNFLFITLIIRSGVQILARRPKFYWSERCTPGTEWLSFSWLAQNLDSSANQSPSADAPAASLAHATGGVASPARFRKFYFSQQALALANNWHYLSVFFWTSNGAVYVVLLFATNSWRRLLPTSFDIIPKALNNLIEYASFHVPTSISAGHYDALQQLAYAFVVFIMAPLSMLTGAAISPSLGERHPWYPRLFGGRQVARSIHVLLLFGYILFVLTHVSMVLLTGFVQNMNRIVLGHGGDSCLGAIIGVIAIACVLAVHTALLLLTHSFPDRTMTFVKVIPEFFTRTFISERSHNDVATGATLGGADESAVSLERISQLSAEACTSNSLDISPGASTEPEKATTAASTISVVNDESTDGGVIASSSGVADVGTIADAVTTGSVTTGADRNDPPAADNAASHTSAGYLSAANFGGTEAVAPGAAAGSNSSAETVSSATVSSATVPSATVPSATVDAEYSASGADFANNKISKVVGPSPASRQSEAAAAGASADDRLREMIRKMMVEDGLVTQMQPFPESNKEFEAILAQLREVDSNDVRQKLIISGFYPKPVEDMRCLECIYYQVHRKWCDIKELELPVEPEWWCRLWRI
jgi:thiosulfate reductase cytochrome b subunit